MGGDNFYIGPRWFIVFSHWHLFHLLQDLYGSLQVV